MSLMHYRNHVNKSHFHFTALRMFNTFLQFVNDYKLQQDMFFYWNFFLTSIYFSIIFLIFEIVLLVHFWSIISWINNKYSTCTSKVHVDIVYKFAVSLSIHYRENSCLIATKVFSVT